MKTCAYLECKNRVEYATYCSNACRQHDLDQKVVYKDRDMEVVHWFFEGVWTGLIKFFDYQGKEKFRTIVTWGALKAMGGAVSQAVYNATVGTAIEPKEKVVVCSECGAIDEDAWYDRELEDFFCADCQIEKPTHYDGV